MLRETYPCDALICENVMDISFLISSLAIENLMSLKLYLCALTILGFIIWLEKKKKN